MIRMPQFVKSYSMLTIASVGTVIYWVLTFFITGSVLQEFFNSIVLGVAVVVVITWARAAYSSIGGRAWGENQVIIGIFTVWLVLILHRLATIAYISLDRPEWFNLNTILGFLGYLFMLTGLLFMTAPANVKNPDPAYRGRLIIAIMFGVIAALLSYWAQVIGWTDLRNLNIRVQ